jgi:glycosyltransferase A (GT-A) superfamily protein (DUF2064 family)
MSTLFAMLARDPEPGKVKPGLAEALGAPTAAKMYRSFIMDLCERFARLSVHNRILAYAPRGARKAVSLLASRHWRLVQQEGTSRGQVLAAIFEYAFRLGYQRAVVMLTDCPTVPDAFVIEAFDKLLIDDVVLGPTVSGGLYLVGLSLERPELFLGVDFSAPGVFDTLVDRAEAHPDLLLLDIMMPKVSGFEICRKLKSDPATAGIPICMVTALNEDGDIERAVDAGTDDFLSKPVNRWELLTRVRSLLRVRHLQNELERTLSYLEEVDQARGGEEEE